MIRRIQALRYRVLRYINVKLPDFLVLTGPNGTGKSTFIDVISLIRDIIIESPQSAMEKRAHRFEELLWNKEGNGFEIALELEIPGRVKQNLRDKDFSIARYQVSIQPNSRREVVINNENLWLVKTTKTAFTPSLLFSDESEEPEHLLTPRSGWERVVSKSAHGNDYFMSETNKWTITYKSGATISALSRVPEDEDRFPVALWVREVLTNGVRLIRFNSDAVRGHCRPDAPTDLQTDGSNLPKVLQRLMREEPELFADLLEKIKSAFSDIAGVEVGERILDRFLYLVFRHESGLELPASLISEGILRFLINAIPAYLLDKDRVYMMEEPENGLYPSAVGFMFQALSSPVRRDSQSTNASEAQFILSTHSPTILKLVDPKHVLCFSKIPTGATNIMNGSENQAFIDWRNRIDPASLSPTQELY